VNAEIHAAASCPVEASSGETVATALWLEKETRKLYGTATKIGSCFPVRLFPESKLKAEQVPPTPWLRTSFVLVSFVRTFSVFFFVNCCYRACAREWNGSYIALRPLATNSLHILSRKTLSSSMGFLKHPIRNCLRLFTGWPKTKLPRHRSPT
jgi:hypothetical protein